jgi:hypothetical protein
MNTHCIIGLLLIVGPRLYATQGTYRDVLFELVH